MEDNAYPFLRPRPVRRQFNPELQANPRSQSISCSNVVLKILVMALFLCLIPMFPSEPPEFMSETVFAKFWELIHLFFIAIALSYGLFCRRKNPEPVSPKSHSFQQYKHNNAAHHSSFFNCVDENPSVKTGTNVVENKSCDSSSFRREPCPYPYPYPYVVVRQGNGERGGEGYLGLPVRSLRSRVVESDSESEDDECVSECETDCSDGSSCSNPSSCTKSEKGEILEGNAEFRSYGYDSRFMAENDGVEPRSMKKDDGFMENNGDYEVHCRKGESFEGNVGSHVFPNESMVAGFTPGSGRGGNLERNMEISAPSNGWKIGSMRRTAFMPGNVGSTAFPHGWNSQSVKTGYMAQNGNNVELGSARGENLEEKLGIPLKSRSMRSSFMVNDVGTFDSEFSKSQPFRFRPPVERGAPCGMNAAACNWFPESPNMVEGIPWNGVNNIPFPSFHTQVDNSYLMGSAPTLEKCPTNSNFFIPDPSTTIPPSATVSTGDAAPGSRMHGCAANTFVENSNTFMPSGKDLAQPIFRSSSPKKKEGYFITRTPDISPSTLLRPSGDLASSVREPRRSKSKLKHFSKKNVQQLEQDLCVESLAPGDNSRASPVITPVTLSTAVENVIPLPINGSFPKKNDDFFLPVGPNNMSTPLNTSDSILREVPNSEVAPSVKAPAPDNGVRSESNNETPKDDVIASTKDIFLNKNERTSTPPVKWDEDCFVIPLSESNDIEYPESNDIEYPESNDIEDPVLEPADMSEVASSRSRRSCDEQGSEHSGGPGGVEDDVVSKEINEVVSKEIEAFKPSTPSPPVTPPVESISKALSDGFLLVESPKKEKILSKAPHSRGFSCTSFFDRDLRKSIRNEAREENRMSEGDQYVGKSGKCGCLSLDVRPTLSKAALKGKSVRTIRPREVVQKTINSNVQSEQKKEENSGMVVIQIGIREKRPSCNGRKREKQGSVGTSIIVGVKSKEGSNNCKAGVKEEEADSEIDKKADEFIAKFKEQIRSSRTHQVPHKNS